jgi:hypothetical protein
MMPRTKPLRLLIGLRLRHPDSEAARRAAEAFLEEVASLEPSVRLPVAWNLPLAPFGGGDRAELAVEIKTRVRARSDSVLLMGFEGAPHPFLAAEELDKELAWCRRNPWGTAAKSLFGQEPRHLLPLAADLAREALDGVYGRHGFESVGLAEPLERAAARFTGPGRVPGRAASRPARTVYRFPAERRAGRAVLYPAWVVAADGGTRPMGRAEPSALLAAAGLAGRQPLFLLLEPAGGPVAGGPVAGGPVAGGPDADPAATQPAALLLPLLQMLESRFQPEFLTLEEALAAEPPRPGEEASVRPTPADPLPLLCPSILEAASRAEVLRARARRRTDADLRGVLEALGSSPARARTAARPREARRPAEPTLIAAMSGLVSLQGDALSATFADGRLSGLQRAQAGTLGAGPADSYLIAGDRFLPLESESAFSFEQGQDSGLRSVLKTGLDGGEVELVIQACFREGREDLELDCRLRFPELSPELDIQGVVPLELPVFALAGGEQVTVSAELLGGGSHTAILEAEEGETLFTGSRLSLRKSQGGPALVFSSGTPSGVLVLGVRVIRLRRGLHLLASPFGARFAAPARLYSGRTLGFALRLGLEG